MFEPVVFRKQMCCIEENTSDIVGTFRRPSQSFSARGIVLPLSPLVTPLTQPKDQTDYQKSKHFSNVLKDSSVCDYELHT